MISKKGFHYLAGFWFGHADLSLQASDQFSLVRAMVYLF